jgi:site-specific DNA-cytosine methylase
MPDNVDKLFEIMQAKGAASDRDKFRKVFLTPGNKGYKIRKDIYDGLRADGIIDSPTYEDFRRKLRLGGTPTVNKYRQQMFSSVDPNKSRASELTHRAVGQAVRATNNVRKPVVAKVVNQKGKPTGKEFAITPAKTVEDLDREYAQEATKNWENELHDQIADADKDAAKISDMFKSFIGSTDEVGSVWGNMTRGGGIAGTPHSVTTNNGILENTEARQILAAGDYNRKRRELLQLEKDSRNGAIFDNHSFFRGMYDAAKDTGFLTGGASDLINAGSLLATKQDLDNGVHTEAGDMLMQQAVKNSDAQSQYGDNQGWMYTGGVITTNMAPFMMQVASAGFSKGMSNAIGKVVQGAASKVALGTMEKATGMAGAHIANYIGKVTGLTTKAFGKAIQYGIVGAAQANTVGLGNVANDVINRYTGQVYQDEHGNYKFGTFDTDGKLVHEGGEDFLTALVKGEAAQTIEFATELAGGGIDAVGTALKNFVTKGGKKIINKYNMDNVSKVIDFLLNNKVSKNARYLKAGADRTLGKVELNSIVGESLEEELGIIANTVFTGDNKISDLWDEKQQSQIWGGMLLSIGLMKGAVAPFHAYNAKQYYSYKHKLDKADVNLSQLLGKEKWEELRNQIDATTNDDMPEMVNKINRDVALGKNRQPVREYIQNLLIMRGYDIGNMLAAKKAVEDKGEGVSVKNMEKNQAYQQGRDAYGYDTHEIQLDQEDKQKSLAQLLGISEQQLASMSDEELETLSGRDDNIDRAIYDYQLSTARYEGVIDNARDQIDLEVQRAAQAVDMYTDKSRNTIRNATIKATGGLEDYGVYIINGNIATHEDGSIDISNSDDMILYYDPTTNTVEHADAMMFAELGSEENADEVRNQAMADAKEKAIKETTGIIDGVVDVGTQFKTVDADGTEHTYEVLADNGDGTAMITIDGNIPTELVKGENVNVPVSFEELQKMKDESDQQRLQAAKAEREQMEKERTERQNQQTEQTEETQPSFDFNQILNDDGNVVLVDVLDKDSNTKYPNSQLFLIRDSGAKAKVMELTSDGSFIPHAVNKKDVRTATTMTLDEYKQAMAESSMIEDNSGENRGEIEVETPTIEGEIAAPAEETAAPESAETPATEQTPAAPAITLEDGTIVPMLEDGNPDFSKLTAAQTAELYDNQFGEDADSIVSGYVSDAKKALDKASNMTVKGKTFVEQKAAKDAKEKAIADAKAAYDSAIAIRDAYNERQLAKVEDTAEGRKELIEKARRKFARLKSAVKDDAEAVSQLYRDTIGYLLHRLYDGTGIDVTDTIPLTAEEYVASNLGAHSLNYEGTETSKGVKQETGLSRKDFAETQLLAADGKGTTIDNLVHSLWENRPSNLDSLDTQDIRNALLSIITSGFKASEARNYIENLRIARAENFKEEEKKAADNAAFAKEQKAKQEEEQGETEQENTDKEKNEKINEQTNENINAPEQNKFPDKLREGSKTIEVPEDATDENPLGLQLSEDKVPFEIEGGKSGETYNINDNEDRQRLINDNKVDDKDILDIDMPKHVHKAIKELCKKMGLKVQFLYMGARSNGWIENGTMYLALDTEKATQFVFGHEMTHAIKQKNPEAYKELVKVAMAITTRKKFEEDLAKIYQNYYGISGYNNIDDYVEEVVADKLGKFINDFDLAQKFSLRLNHPVLATILHAIQKIKGLLYGDFYKSVDALERIVEKAYVDTAKGEVTNSETGEDVSFSLRQKPEPKKKGIGYKVFVLKDGKLYPPMVANPDGAATPVGVWLDADAAPIAGESKTGRPQVKQGGKGTQGGSGKLAYRPGWHLGVVPYAIQFNRKDAEGNKTLFPKNFVFAEVEYAADVDYQEEARQEGINPSGKYQHSLAGLKHLPTDGYYMYRTNPNPETDPWVITGAMKVNRILTRAEQADLVSKAGREPQQIQEGDIVTDDVVNSINQEIADAPKFSLKDNQENPLNQDGTLKLDKIKSVDELTDEDFTSAFRNVELPAIPKNVDAAIGANGKPIVIKKNIFEKNWNAHKFTPAESKKVLNDALYNTDLVGHTQPTKKPNHWVAIKLDDKSPITVLEVNDNKNNVEVVGWYTLDERNLGRIKRQAERNGGELIMLTPKDDKVESLSTPPLSSAAKIDNSSETAKENGEKFSLKNEKTMFGMHNISVDKLRKAIKQGGFAAPSMGVVDSKNGIYSDYGEITLIPKAEKLAKRTGKNAGTFTADAWTPTYPQVERIMNKQGEKAFNTDMNVKLGDVDNGIYSNVRESWKGYLSSGDVRDGLYWHYLFDNGMNPETIYQTGKYDNDITNEVMRISDNGNKTDYTDKEVAELIQLMNKATGKDNDVDAQREKLKARIASAEKQGNHLLVALKKKRLEELEGVENFYIAADFVNDVVRNNRKNGKVDVHDTMGTAKKKVEDNKKLSDDFPSWLDKKTEEYGVEEMLYNGTTPSGKPKYIPNTIENAVKLMKKQGVAGGYTAFGSELGVFIAKNSPEVNTLAAMKNAKDKLIPFGDERHNQIKDKITKEFLELSDEIRVGSNNRYAFDDSGVSRMVELTDHKGNEKEYLKKAYNIEVSDEWMDRYNKLLDTIKKDYKVFYFETKFMRPYGLDEFEKAIVPSDTPSDVIDALKKAGIDVSSYERGNAEDRQKVTMDAINSSDNIRFSLAGERGAAAADKAEERTFRMDNLSVAKDMEKNKKKDKAIKAATGWERGADGKWRYEMPDVVLRDPKEWVNKKTLTLSDIVEKPNDLFKEYPELFDAYPKLKDVKIQKGRAKMGGSYYDNTITLNLGGIREAMKYDLDIHYKIATRLLKRTLVHEVQHYIQHEEGFAKGGSEQFVRDAIKDEFEKVIKQIRGLRAEGKEDEAKALAERNKALYNAYSNEKDSYKNYKSLSGEVEARNVSARLKMTPEERRKALAESTEDVARKDQIFLGVGDVSFSLRDMADGKESGAADMAEDLKSLNTPDEVDDAIKTAIEDMPSGWKMANKKMIHIAQALGENRKAEIAGEEPKFSLKDGTLIKAGTYFSGGGLVEEGLKGIIDPVVAVEYDEKISGVYRNNFGQHIVTADVRDVDPKELVKQIDGEVEYFHASPVCKNYSQAKSNHAEVELDKETAASTAEFINAIKPKVVTIENVKGYKDSDAMKTITDALDANGYTWDADVYNAADYGGYTNRERLIVRAVRDGKLPEKPKKMARKSGWYEAVADIIPTLTEKKNGVAPWMDIRLKADGIDWKNIDKPLYVMGSAYADGKVPHAFADELLPTLRTKSGDVIVMPDGKVYRAMGRVLARVSGVSDDYKMPFSENLSHTIIGNGIPTQLTEHVIAPLLTGSDPKFSLKKTKNVKDSRIIPTDVDKSVSSQIEKKYDSAIKEVMNKVAERDKRLVSNYIEQDLSDFSKMRREDINQELKSNENWRRKNLREENREGSTYGITDARHRITEATAERELEYRDARAKYLSETYGLQGGRQTSLDMVDRAFEDTLGNETNRGELRELYGRARKILVQVGAEFGGVDNAKQEGDLGFAGTDRDISLFIDTMTRTSTPPSELSHTILHEMIHQATIGSINLVKKGMADGMLTPKQIEAVNTIINTYDAYKADRRLVWEEDNYRDYGGKDEYEFAAEMADVKQRRILSIPYGERILNAANELKRVGDISLWQAIKNALRRLFEVSDKSKMDKALSDIMDDFNKNIDDISMNNIEQTDFGLNGNTRFSLRYDKFEHDLNQWKKDNNLPKDAQRPTIPQRNAGESAVDFLRRVDEYRKQMALWKTAPTYEQHLLSDDTALGEFNRELQRGSVLKRIAFQDSMLAIRKAQEAIMKEVGVDRLNMAEDAYTAENRSHGKGKNEFEEYNNEFLQPLRKAYHQMKKILGDSYDNVRIYMMAKHGLERDAQMAFKKSLDADYEDVAQRSAAYKAYKGDMNRIINDSDLEFGRVDFTTWRKRDNALRVKYSPSYMDYRYDKNGIAYDYSGLSAIFDGSDFEEAAYKLVKDIESKYVAETHDLWDATNAATKKILRDGYKAGMMSKDTYQYVRDMYSHYIPLRGWDGTTADQVWDYIGGGKGAFNQTLKKAHGRTSIADDPIAYIENMAESGILLNNKNWVKQHLMLLAQNHPTSLLTLSKAWYVKSTDANGNEEWIPATPQISSQMNSNQVKAAIDAFEKKMEQMAQAGDATQKRDGLNIAYPQTQSEEREHEVRVMKDGEEYVIYVNGDPQLAQAMNNTRAHRVSEGIKNSISKRVIAVVGRKMAAAYTSLSPLFIPSNYFRDLTMTLASTAIREDAKYNYLLRKNLATSWNLGFMLRDFQNGKLRDKVNNGNATPKEQMFYDFMMNGGETGFVSSLDVEDLKKKFKNDLKDLDRWKANPVKVGHTIMDSIEFLNRMIEDSNRFAVYMTSIQYGRSIDEAVNDAKDVTLNFNRKGTGEHSWQTIRNLYLFINPAVQSLQTLGALAKHHPFKFTAVTASWLASGVLVPIVNVALMQLGAAFLGGDGDDDKDWYKDISKKYWQFSKWDRRNNFIMWVPTTHEFVKIPLAQEFRAFYGLGDMIASKMMGGELAEESWEDYGWDLVGQVVDMLPLDPTGYDGNIAVSLMPNAIRPVFELAFNVDFTGKPLFKDTEYNKYDPNFTKAYVGTPDWLVRASRMVNSIGNDYSDVQQNSIDAFGDPRYNLNNPAVVDHVLSSYLGGAYTMGSQVLGLLTKSLNDRKEIKVADIPLVSKFVSNPDDRPVSKKQGDEFWDKKEYYDRASNTISKLKKQAKINGDYSLLERFYGSGEYKTYKLYEKDVKDYKEARKKERAEESGDEYRPHQLNAEDIYNNHVTPMDEFEDMKLKQLFEKLNSFKTRYDAIVDNAPNESDGYYNTNKAAIDAIDEISLDKQEISELKKGFLDDGKDAYNAEDMKQIRDLRKKILSVLEKANKVVVANQKAKAKK